MGVINVTSPTTGDVWARTSTHTIRWQYSFGMTGNVKITLLNSGGAEIGIVTYSTPVITDGINLTGSYDWEISPSGTTGDGYRIKIQSLTETNVVAYSNQFYIAITDNLHCPTHPDWTSKGFVITSTPPASSSSSPIPCDIYIDSDGGGFYWLTQATTSRIVLCFDPYWGTHKLEFRTWGYEPEYRTVYATPYSQLPDETITLIKQSPCNDPTVSSLWFTSNPAGVTATIKKSSDPYFNQVITIPTGGVGVCTLGLGTFTITYKKLKYITKTETITITNDKLAPHEWIPISVTLDLDTSICTPTCLPPKECIQGVCKIPEPTPCDGMNRDGKFDASCVLENPLYLIAGAALLAVLLMRR